MTGPAARPTTPPAVERYLSKISGPLLDRIDIHLEVPQVPFRELSNKKPGTNSATHAGTGVGGPGSGQAERFEADPGDPRRVHVERPDDGPGRSAGTANWTRTPKVY